MFQTLVIFSVLLQSFEYANAALKVSLSTNSIMQVAGSTIWVGCSANLESATIKWDKDGPIPYLPASGKPPGPVYIMMNNTLKIVGFKRRLAGSYKCIALSGEESVIGAVLITLSQIQIMNEIDDVGVYAGEATTIRCVPPLGNPEPKLLWLKNGKVFFDADIDQSDWILKISAAKLENSGNYTCVAMGVKNRTASSILTVHTHGTLDATPKNVSVIEKDPVKFTCKSDTNPPLPLKWIKTEEVCGKIDCKHSEQEIKSDSGRVILKNGTLEILNVKISDKGIYSCKELLGSIFDTVNVTLNVIELISVDFLDKTIEIDKERQKIARIDCMFRGDNVQNITWVKGDTGILPSHMHVEDAALVINNTSLNDTGEYKCTVTGPHNNDFASVKIEVFIAPKFKVRPTNVTGELGKPVWVHCGGTGYPIPQVIYLRSKNGDIKGGELNETHFVRYPNGSMKIVNLEHKDKGSYICWLKNDYSTIVSTFWISVTEKKEGKGTSPMHRTIGIAVGCAGLYILLVIGLMIYCRARRARLLKGIITEVDGEGNVKDPLVGEGSVPMETVSSTDQYEFNRESVEEIESLGHGKMGRVFKGYGIGLKSEEKRTLIAVKEFGTVDQEHKEEFNLEVEMLSHLKHVNVVKLLGVSTAASPWYLITDYGEEGDMKKYLKNCQDLDVTDRLGMSLCIANGMDYLINQDYIHRDLAARNCVVKSNKSVMVSFFSLCEDVYRDDYYNVHEIPVPLRWLSPEAIQSESYSEKSDVWSFGVTVWEVFMSGEQPYSGYDDDYVHQNVCKDLRLARPSGCPDAVFNILQKCWSTNADERPSFTEIASMIVSAEAK